MTDPTHTGEHADRRIAERRKGLEGSLRGGKDFYWQPANESIVGTNRRRPDSDRRGALQPPPKPEDETTAFPRAAAPGSLALDTAPSKPAPKCSTCGSNLVAGMYAQGVWIADTVPNGSVWTCTSCPPSAPTPVQRAGAPYLANRADGVNGHYCIGRTIDGMASYWNPSGWFATGYLFFDKDLADAILTLLAARPTTEGSD